MDSKPEAMISKHCRYCGGGVVGSLFDHERNCVMKPEPAGHDPDLDENGRCRICGEYEGE